MTYTGIRFTEKTLEDLETLIQLLHLPNSVPRNKLHCTLLYSKVRFPNYEPAGTIDPLWYSTYVNPKLTKSGEVVTLFFECPELEMRYKELMNEHARGRGGLRILHPHVTLSYKARQTKVGVNVLELVEGLKVLEMNEEYMEPFDIDWENCI